MKEKETNNNQFNTFNKPYLLKKNDELLKVDEYSPLQTTDECPSKRRWIYYI